MGKLALGREGMGILLFLDERTRKTGNFGRGSILPLTSFSVFLVRFGYQDKS
jgi:hypothetical protein